MARIIENDLGRRQIKISADDVISIVKEYQYIRSKVNSYESIYEKLKETHFYLPEEI